MAKKAKKVEKKRLKKQNKINVRKEVVVVILLSIFLAGVLIYTSTGPTGLHLGGCVGVIEINGEISTKGEPQTLLSQGKPSSRDIAKAIEAMGKDDNIKAIVVVINSPGGSVVATHEIWDALKSIDKPKVAYFREVAASGGYYVSTATDYIISDPDALTGSIGVIAMFSNVNKLMEKLGVNVTVIKSGQHKDMGGMFRGIGKEEKEMLQSIIDETYNEFISVIEEGRGNRLRKQFYSIADGRVISGREALRVGMVDSLGTYKDALRKAAEMGNIKYSKDVPTCKVDPMDYADERFSIIGNVKPINIDIGRFGLYYMANMGWE